MDFSLILPCIVTLVGAILLIRLRAFFVFHPIRTARDIVEGLKDRGARRAFFLALAGTLGVGNIFGVAAGIMIGGAGSLFWLFISSFFAMIIKYAETLLAFDVGVDRGGSATVIKSVFPKWGRALSLGYVLLTLLLAFSMGSAMQTAALIDVAEKSLRLSPVISAFILLILLLPALVGGGKKIEEITEFVIPLTTVVYILMCLCVIFLNFDRLAEVIKIIISSAFNFRSAACGISVVAIREGFARGILSNEAGVGTSAMAHVRSKDRSPHTAGLFAMCEVVFDSLILCMLTGIVILLSVEDATLYDTPMALVTAAFTSTLGSFSGYVLTLLILSFAYATVICWYYYGAECVELYFRKIKGTYPLFFVISMVLPSIFPSSALIFIIDLILLFMSLMILSAILRRSPRIAELCFGEQKRLSYLAKTKMVKNKKTVQARINE